MIIYDPIIINKSNSTLKWYYKNSNSNDYKNMKFSQFRKKINLNETLIDILIDAKCKQIVYILNHLNEQLNNNKIVLMSKKDKNDKIEFNYVSEAYNSYENPIKIVRKFKKLIFFDSQFNTTIAEIKRLEKDVEYEFFAKSKPKKVVQNKDVSMVIDNEENQKENETE